MLKRLMLCLLLTTAALAQAQTKSDKPVKPKQPTPAVTKQPLKRIVTDLSGFDLLPKDKAQKQTTVAGATRGGQRIIALAPHLGKIYSKNPVFNWEVSGSAKRFRFILMNDGMDEIFHADVEGNQIRYPDTAPILEDSKTYFWIVEPTNSLFLEASTQVGFVVMSPEQRARIEPALKSARSHDKRAQVFTDHRLWYDAIEAYNAALGENPRSSDLYEARGTVFAQIEATRELAEADFKRAAELGK